MAVSSPGGRNTKSTHLQLQTGSREVEPDMDMGGCFKLPGRLPVTQFLQDGIPSKPPQVAAPTGEQEFQYSSNMGASPSNHPGC